MAAIPVFPARTIFYLRGGAYANRYPASSVGAEGLRVPQPPILTSTDSAGP